jgi:hypothetical protein
MSFLAPAAFALTLLLPIIVVLYLLRLRRTEQVVSSTYLWRRMVRDLEANAPWQRLRRSLLLILQLLTLIALILALARPFTWAEGTGGQAAILILDTSASMAAVDVSPNRLEAAKTQALRYVDGLPDGARVTVIAAGDGAQVLASSSQDRRQVRLAIQSAQIGQPGWGSDLSAALELGAAIAARRPDAETVVYSDGRVDLPQHLALEGHARYLPMGISGDNQAIGALTLQPAPGGGRTVFVQVINYGPSPVQRRLVLSSVAGPAAGGARQTLNVYDLDLAPGELRAVVAEGLPPEVFAVEAQLLGEDVLAADDRAWAVHSSGQPARITLVTEGNLFLETGLGLLPNLEVTTVRPGDWEAGKVEDWKAGKEAGPEDSSSNLSSFHPSTLTILDAYVPITATLPRGNLLFIAPPRSTEVFSVTGQVEQPALRAVGGGGSGDAADPLLAHVDVAGVGVQQAVRVSLPAWARPVIVGDVDDGDAAPRSVPILWAGEQGGRRIAVLAFDLRRSDLPLQVAFPLLLANLTGWLAPSGGSDLPAQVAPGAVVSLSLPPDVQAARVARPDGSRMDVEVRGGQAILADTGMLGIYRVAWGEGGQAAFAVNLFAPSESDLEPARNLALSAGEAETSGAASEGGGARGARREWWRPLALIALLVLFAEWLVHHRATLVRIWAQARALFPGVRRQR